MTRAAVNRDVCQGHGRCQLEAPTIFEVDDSGKAVVVKKGNLTTTEEEELEWAVESCPEGAVSLISER